MHKLFAFFFLLAPSLFAAEFNCQMQDLTLFSRPWETSPDFMTINFEGPFARDQFQDIGEPGSSYFSVILSLDWCRSLQDAILCETPLSALAEIESSETPTSPKTKTSLRYFLTILNYRKDGWAVLKTRAKRLDLLPPITFLTEFPAGSCSVTP
jgi:hypothetical protein